MKLNISNYEVDVKARFSWEARNSKESAMYILNTLSLYAREAARLYEMEGTQVLADEARKISDDIYNFLYENGAYDK